MLKRIYDRIRPRRCEVCGRIVWLFGGWIVYDGNEIFVCDRHARLIQLMNIVAEWHALL